MPPSPLKSPGQPEAPNPPEGPSPPKAPNPPDSPGQAGRKLKAGARTRELMVRIASAIVLIPLVLLMVLKGEKWFLVLVGLGVGLLSIEWGMMAAPRVNGRIAVAVALAALAGLFTGFLDYPLLSFVMLLFGALCTGLYAHRLGVGWMDAAYGVLYIGFPSIVLMWMHATHNGPLWVTFAFLVAWAADSAAYIVGRIVGGPKLWRRYSPNKTWAGFVGGIIAGMLTAAALSDQTHVFAHDTSASIVGLIVALSTMAGDLWESALKRRFGVKDAGSLIPGHGGLMDRVDGLMFAIVALGGIRLLVLWGTQI